MTKKCSKCGIPKKLSEYYRSPGSTDGHKNKCKSCCREYQNGKTIKTSALSNGASCGEGWGAQECRFLAECKEQVMIKDWYWNPPCFVSSAGHEAYVAEYGRRQE